MATHRPERISEALREELDELIAYELSDARIGETAVTEVHMTGDMRHAWVRLHVGNEARESTIEALNHAKHFLRRQLAERLNLYRVPELHFEADSVLGEGVKVEQLLKRVRRGRPRDQQPE